MAKVIRFKPAQRKNVKPEDDDEYVYYVQYVAMYYARLIQEGETLKAQQVLRCLQNEPHMYMRDLPDHIKKGVDETDFMKVLWFYDEQEEV